MAEVVLFDWAAEPSIGVRVLRRSLIQSGLDAEVIGITRELAQRFRDAPFLKKETAEKTYREIIQMLEKHPLMKGTKFFGMTMYDTESAAGPVVELTKRLKQTHPSLVLIGGGPAFNSSPKAFFSQAKLSYAIRGEAENSFPQLIKALKEGRQDSVGKIPGIVFRKRSRIIVTPPVKLPAEQIINSPLTFAITGHRANTYTERGCSNACIFCGVPRKGVPVAVSDERILESLLELAKDARIKQVDFADDQLFFNEERTMRLLGKIMAHGLHKRFQFSSLATIDSFIKSTTINGEPVKRINGKLIKLIRDANFRYLEIGTEALNDNMLKEIKSGRYTAVQAMKVNRALSMAGITTHNFLIAGGIHTRSIDFLESYYRTLVKDLRNLRSSIRYGDMNIMLAQKNTPVYHEARREGALFGWTGRPAGKEKGTRIQTWAVVPKDPVLREFILERLRSGKTHIDGYDLGRVIIMGKALAQTNPRAATFVRKLLTVKGNLERLKTQYDHTYKHFLPREQVRAFIKRGKRFDKKTLETMPAEEKKELAREIGQEVKNRVLEHARLVGIASRRTGIERLRVIQELRRRTGQGMTLLPRRTVKK